MAYKIDQLGAKKTKVINSSKIDEEIIKANLLLDSIDADDVSKMNREINKVKSVLIVGIGTSPEV